MYDLQNIIRIHAFTTPRINNSATSQLLKTFIILLNLLFSINEIHCQTISFEYYQRLIFLKLKVNNSDSLLFLMDTGANASAIDTKTAEKLNLKNVKIDSVEGTAGTILVPSVKAKKVSVGKSIVKDIVFTKYDLSGSLTPPNQHLDGILGTDFLKHFIVTIDFKNKLLSFNKNKSKSQLISFPFDMDNGIPRIKAVINNAIQSYFRYDSGSSLFETSDVYLNITASIKDSLLNINPNQKAVSHLSATGIGGTIDLPVYKIESVTIGSLSINKVYLIVQPLQGYFARKDAVGFFGNNLLEKYDEVVLDFKEKRIYLKKA